MNPRFDLVDITRTLQRRVRYILAITVAAAVLGGIFYLVQKKKYKATTEFFVANPAYTDRHNLFRTDRSQIIDYFGTEDDIDRVIAISKSEQAKMKVIFTTGLNTIYKLDTTKKGNKAKLLMRYTNAFDIKRTEYKNVEVSFTDADPKVAAMVANKAVEVIDDIYTSYYGNIRRHVQQSLSIKLRETDSAIAVLTDSLAVLRDQHGIYDILSPSRQTLISNTGRGGGPGYGKAIEQLQNIESIKDQLVMDRAHYTSVINEFTTGNRAGDMPLIQVMSPAEVPAKPSGLGLILTVVACALIALFFSTVWVLLTAYFRTITATDR